MFFFGILNKNRFTEFASSLFDVETVTPEKYVRIYGSDPESIERVRVVPPNLGEGDFGKILIKRRKSAFEKSRNFSR